MTSIAQDLLIGIFSRPPGRGSLAHRSGSLALASAPLAWALHPSRSPGAPPAACASSAPDLCAPRPSASAAPLCTAPAPRSPRRLSRRRSSLTPTHRAKFAARALHSYSDSPLLVFAKGEASPCGRVELDRGEGVAQLVGVVAAIGYVAQAELASVVVTPALDAAVVEQRASMIGASG